MLYVNGEKVDLTGTSKYAKEFQSAKKEIDKLGYPVQLRIVPTWVTGTQTTQGQWVQNIPVQKLNYAQIEHRSDEGSVEWRYTPTPPRTVNGELRWPMNGERYFENNRRIEKIGKDKIDLIFFLLYKSPYNGMIFNVVDEVSESEKEVEEEMKQVQLQKALYDVLKGNPEKLRTVAQSWGVSVGNVTNEAVILRRLKSMVIAGENAKQKKKGVRGIAEFLEDVQLNELTKIRALIQEARDASIIEFSSNKYNYGWFFLDRQGQPKDKITGIAPKSEDVKEQKLAEYLKNNTAILNTLKESLGYNPQDNFDPNLLDTYSYKGLQEIGKKIGLEKVVGIKQETLKEKIKEHYNVG